MGYIEGASYAGVYPTTHARIAHANNWETGGTVAASTTATDYFDDGPDNTLTYERWKPTTLPATWQYTFAASSSFDYCVIGAHTMGTNGNTLEVQVYDSGAWTDVITATAILDDMPIFVQFNSETDTIARIRITNGTAPEIGVIKFGLAMEMPRPIYGGHTPLDLSRQTTMRSNQSSTGEFLGRTKLRTMYATDYAWTNIPAAWVRANWRAFQTAIEDDAFFIAWRPGSFSEVGLVHTDQPPTPYNNGTRDLMDVTLAVTGYGYDL